MNRSDLFIDLTFDDRPAGSMFRDDWEALLVAVEPDWGLPQLRDFIAAQQFVGAPQPAIIAVNVKRYFRREW